MGTRGLLKGIKDLVVPSLYAAKGRNLPIHHTAAEPSAAPAPEEENPLAAYFRDNEKGPGIWKWHHYFDVYHRHLARFRGKKINVLEIGIYSGGSLGMWLNYFGADATIYGVDIEPDCKVYENDRIKVAIGNQGDRVFWRDFLAKAPPMDVVIDDGSHLHEDQIITLEEVLPTMNRGGVFVCEDVHDRGNRFASYVMGIADQLNDPHGEAFKHIDCVAFYPFITIVEKRMQPLAELTLEKRGTEWQPPDFGEHTTRTRLGADAVLGPTRAD